MAPSAAYGLSPIPPFAPPFQDHADADLANVPGDMVTTSGSGLDPHITLQNAEYQLDRLASKWVADTKSDPAQVHQQIEQMLQAEASAPMDGLFGEKMINVLQVNLELRQHFGPPPRLTQDLGKTEPCVTELRKMQNIEPDLFASWS